MCNGSNKVVKTSTISTTTTMIDQQHKKHTNNDKQKELADEEEAIEDARTFAGRFGDYPESELADAAGRVLGGRLDSLRGSGGPGGTGAGLHGRRRRDECLASSGPRPSSSGRRRLGRLRGGTPGQAPGFSSAFGGASGPEDRRCGARVVGGPGRRSRRRVGVPAGGTVHYC